MASGGTDFEEALFGLYAFVVCSSRLRIPSVFFRSVEKLFGSWNVAVCFSLGEGFDSDDCGVYVCG